MKQCIALGLLALCFIACGEKGNDIEQIAKEYSKDILSGNIEQIAKNARMPEGQALDSEQIANFIKERKYLSQEYRLLAKQSGGLKETVVSNTQCLERLPEEKLGNICVVYLDLLFNDSARVPMAVPLVEVEKKWYPVFDASAYPSDELPNVAPKGD